jgi:2-hydroxy-6-oxonona-2,4-dienedioate hydrolase
MALTEEGIIDVPGMASRWVKLGNGARAHYMTAGDTGPAVILLHGGIAGSSGLAGWRFMAPFLAQNGFRVFCPDQPGFGLADTKEEYWPKLGQITHSQFVDDFATAMCLDRFHIAGNSMGCRNTTQYVVAHPEKVISFALIAGTVGDLVDSSLLKAATMNVQALFDGTEKSMRSLMESIIYRQGAISDELITMRTNAANNQKDSFNAYFQAQKSIFNDPNLNQKVSTKGRLDAMTLPAIYLYGVDDVLLPVSNGYAQEDHLSNIQFFYPEECGHQGQTDQPEMFSQVFLEFFRDGKVSRKTADWAGVSKRRPEIANLVAQA